MLFLTPNQQCQSTERKQLHHAPLKSPQCRYLQACHFQYLNNYSLITGNHRIQSWDLTHCSQVRSCKTTSTCCSKQNLLSPQHNNIICYFRNEPKPTVTPKKGSFSSCMQHEYAQQQKICITYRYSP